MATDMDHNFAKCRRGKGMVIGDNVPDDAAEGYPVSVLAIKTNATAGRGVFVNVGDESSANFDELLAALVLADAGGLITATNVEAALQELAQHQQSAQAFIPIPLMTLREASAFDVGAIAVNGGLLASDTTPVLEGINGATDGCQRLVWAASNGDQVVLQTPLPPDLDTSAAIVLHVRIASGGTTDPVGFTVDSFFNEGDTKVVDTTTTNQTTTWAEKIATIAAADVPSGAQTLTIGLTPVAHTTDTLNLSAVWIEYARATLTS